MTTDLGKDLFDNYPQLCKINGKIFNLRSISKNFNSIEDALNFYKMSIKNNLEKHLQIISDIKWGIENSYNFTTLDRFIVDRGYEALDAMRNGEGTNVNLEATQLI